MVNTEFTIARLQHGRWGAPARSGERGILLDGVYAALARVPFFGNVRRDAIKLERLDGALTNVCYKVTTGSTAYMLRLAGEGTSDYIDRTAEEHNARVAAAAGVSAEVVY